MQYAVHKVAPVRALIAEKLKYCMTSLRGERIRLKLKTAPQISPQFIDITHWDVSAGDWVLMLFTKWYPSQY